MGLRTGAFALVLAAGVMTASRAGAASETKREKLQEVPGTGALMPLRFTTFGDFYYAISNVESDAFHIGTLELDVSLALNDYVDVTAGLAFNGADGTFGLGSFTIDCGIAGKGSHYLFSKSFLERSGIVFGKFDVPFGIAYLEYASPDNRLVTLPNVVRATHGGWNDVGVQLYAQAPRVNVLAYLVNGGGLEPSGSADASEPSAAAEPAAPPAADDVAGGRFGLTPFAPVEIGVSGTVIERGGDFVSGLYGADLHATPGHFDIRLEAIERLADVASDATGGGYGRALYRFDRFFVTARYGVVLDDARVVDREIAAGLGATVFPKAEIRVVDQYDLDTGAAVVFLQLVGGSAWQPTGFRR